MLQHRSTPTSANPQPRSHGPSSPTTIHSVGSMAKPFKWCRVELDGVSSFQISAQRVYSPVGFFPDRRSKQTRRSCMAKGTLKSAWWALSLLLSAMAPGLYQLSPFRCPAMAPTSWGLNLSTSWGLNPTLGFSTTDNIGATILTAVPLFAGLGCVSAFNHQPLINPAVTPIQPYPRSSNLCASCPLPYEMTLQPSLRN